MNRRFFLRDGFLIVLGSISSWSGIATGHEFFAKVNFFNIDDETRPFHLWASSDSHVDKDIDPPTRIKNAIPRESLAEAIRQSEGTNNDGAPSFDWDIGLHLGDFSATYGSPTDDTGDEVIRQFSALRKHRREQFYSLVGNHDASGPDEPTQWWFKKWIDPTGENTEFSGVDATKRIYPVTGTWERYSFMVGNILFLMMGDRNDNGPPVGRGESGGYPAGAVTGETFEWWKSMVEKNQDKIFISAHHHMLRETTVASGPWEGFRRNQEGINYHGYFRDGGPEGASYLYFVDGKPNAQSFEKYLAAHPGAIDLWLGGHTHTTPDDTRGGRSHIEKKWGVTFINVAALTLYHAATRSPKSRLLSFIPGSKEVKVQCYLHTDHFAPRGWYKPAERIVNLNKPFSWTSVGEQKERKKEELVEAVLSSNCIFLTGSGNSEPLARSVAKHLMRVGFQTYVAGDQTTPAIKTGDLLIGISGSGQSTKTYNIAYAAKNSGASVVLLTSQSLSRIGNISDQVIVINPDFYKVVGPFVDELVTVITKKRGKNSTSNTSTIEKLPELQTVEDVINWCRANLYYRNVDKWDPAPTVESVIRDGYGDCKMLTGVVSVLLDSVGQANEYIVIKKNGTWHMFNTYWKNDKLYVINNAKLVDKEFTNYEDIKRYFEVKEFKKVFHNYDDFRNWFNTYVYTR